MRKIIFNPKEGKMRADNKKYTLEQKEKIIATADTVGDLLAASKQSGVSYQVLKRWEREREGDAAREEFRKRERKRFIKKAWVVVNRAVEKIEQELDNCSPKDAAYIISVLAEKISKVSSVSFSREQSVSIKDLSDEDLDKLLETKEVENQSSQNVLPEKDT